MGRRPKCDVATHRNDIVTHSTIDRNIAKNCDDIMVNRSIYPNGSEHSYTIVAYLAVNRQVPTDDNSIVGCGLPSSNMAVGPNNDTASIWHTAGRGRPKHS